MAPSLWTNGPEWLKDPVNAGNADGIVHQWQHRRGEGKTPGHGTKSLYYWRLFDKVIHCKDFGSFQALLNVT